MQDESINERGEPQIKTRFENEIGAIGKEKLQKSQRKGGGMRQQVDKNAVLQQIRAAATITGLSQKFLRAGCKAGTIPHVRVGNDYRVNMLLLLEKIDEDSDRGHNLCRKKELSNGRT